MFNLVKIAQILMQFLELKRNIFFRFNRSTVKEGFHAVKSDELNAFIYDATVLEYLVGQVSSLFDTKEI